MKLFRKLVDLHQRETDKYTPYRNFTMAASYDQSGTNAGSEQQDGAGGATANMVNTENKKVKQCLNKFELDTFGR